MVNDQCSHTKHQSARRAPTSPSLTPAACQGCFFVQIDGSPPKAADAKTALRLTTIARWSHAFTIPTRTVKRLSADDSGLASVKVGHRQAIYNKHPVHKQCTGCFTLCVRACSHHSLIAYPT